MKMIDAQMMLCDLMASKYGPGPMCLTYVELEVMVLVAGMGDALYPAREAYKMLGRQWGDHGTLGPLCTMRANVEGTEVIVFGRKVVGHARPE